MKEELIKYVMEKADKCYSDDFPIENIEMWINEFFDQYQPERSMREDLIEMVVAPEPDYLTKKRLEEDAEFVKKCGGLNPDLLGCGALNKREDLRKESGLEFQLPKESKILKLLQQYRD